MAIASSHLAPLLVVCPWQVVINNIFDTDLPLSMRFDLKGSSRNRFVPPESDATVLKVPAFVRASVRVVGGAPMRR